MCASEGPTGEIDVQIVGSHGLVWSIPDVLKLRTEHRIVGCMVGGIAKYNNQVAVNGLPLQLSPEEVTLALHKGWVRLYETVFKVPVYTQEAAAAEQQRRQQQQERRRQQQQLQQQPWRRDVEQHDEYYAAYYGLPALLQEQQQQQQQQQEVEQQQQRLDHLLFVIENVHVSSKQQQQQQHCVLQQQEQPKEEQGQQATHAPDMHDKQQQQQQQQCLQGNVTAADHSLEIPLTIHQKAAENESTQLLPAQWSYPQTPHQHMQYLVLRDLHAQGYYLTDGAKFGGDYLAYPGDPNLYHAQFVVRVVPAGACLNPVTFKGVARGVHAARKHLLLATVDDDELQKYVQQQQQDQQQISGQDDAAATVMVVPAVRYITVAKENGFGASKA